MNKMQHYEHKVRTAIINNYMCKCFVQTNTIINHDAMNLLVS